MKKVFILISDNNYLDHCKSLFVNAKQDGNWNGDYCLISNGADSEKLNTFKDNGIIVLEKEKTHKFFAKYYIFEDFFKNWDYVAYMDCDFMIYKDMNSIVDSKIMNQCIFSVDFEPFKISQYLIQNPKTQIEKELLYDISKQFDINTNGFNAGSFFFNTCLINTNTQKDLFEFSEKLKPINNHTGPEGSDQPIFNLYFQNFAKQINNNHVCFWRGINENTIASHFCSPEAPWRNANYSKILNKTYYQKYLENLNAFNKGNFL